MIESDWFYGTFIDPVLVSMRKKMAKQIQPGEKVIDIACRTGAQVFEFAKKALTVSGVDLSKSMINKAKKTKKRMNYANTNFFVGDAANLNGLQNRNFDVASMSLALHQFKPQLHSKILNEMKRLSGKIIIIDYAVPLPGNYAGYGSRIAEFFAGRDHYNNFNQFCQLGGLKKILPQNGLTITHSDFFGKGIFQLVVCTVGG